MKLKLTIISTNKNYAILSIIINANFMNFSVLIIFLYGLQAATHIWKLAGIIYINSVMTFITDPGQLEAGLFHVFQSRYGAQTVININFVPDLLQFIKKQLTSQELIRLEDYHLQNYLMELSINYKQEKSLAALTETILKHIRNNNNFWYRHNNQEQLDEEQQLKHHAIVCYHKDIECLKQAFSSNSNHVAFIPDHQRRTTLNYQFQLLNNNSDPYFGTRQPLNHLAYIPEFLIAKIKEEKRQNLLKDNPEQRNMASDVILRQQSSYELERQIMEECIMFLLSNKTRNSSLVKQSRKEYSDEADEQAENSSSESDNNEEISQEETILDDFLKHLLQFPSLPKFPNSHHMQLLTLNLINSCKKVLMWLLDPSLIPSKQTIRQNERQSHGKTSTFKVIEVDDKVIEVVSTISQNHLRQVQLEMIAAAFLTLWQSKLKILTKQIRKRELSSLESKGWLTSPQEAARVKEAYQNMLDHPQFVELTKYRATGSGIPWKNEDYLKFLQGLKEFWNIPTNNKKIAGSMGQGYEPNHVKHVKGVYLTVMKERMERGECGGGKRGKSLSKLDFIEKDLNNFSMKWFEKAKKIKKRKPKRKRRNSDSEDCEQQPDSEY